MHFKKGSHYASVSVSWVHLHHGEHSSSEINYHTCTVFFIIYAAQFICKWLSHPWNNAIYFPDRYEQWACYSQLNLYRDSVLIYNLMIWYFLFCICSHSGMEIYKDYPTLAREFQGFRVRGKFLFLTLELTDTPTNLANQVKAGHTLDQSHSGQPRRPERAHQNNAQWWRLSRTDRWLSRQFWKN